MLDAEDLRNAFLVDFEEVPDAAVAADEGRPRKRTKTEAIASGNRCQQANATKAAKKKEAFHDMDVYTTSLYYHDKIRDTMYDLAH